MRLKVVVLVLLVSSLACTWPWQSNDITIGCSVQELKNAIDTANATSSQWFDIYLAQNCNYVLDAVDNVVGAGYVEGGPNGLPVISGGVRIYGNNATISRSDVAGTPDFRIFFNEASLELFDVTLQYGVAPVGGAVLNYEGAWLTTARTIFLDNQAERQGGAIWNRNGALRISTGSKFNRNISPHGSAIFSWTKAANSLQNPVIINGSSFKRNRAVGPHEHGGAVWLLADEQNISILNSEFWQNHTDATAAALHLTLQNTSGAGSHSLTIRDTEFIENDALNNSGVYINADGGWTATIEDSLFQGNLTEFGGGGLSVFGHDDPQVIINRTTFEGNQSQGRGGAIYNWGSLMTIEDSAFTMNLAETGGAVNNLSQLDVINSTFVDNEATTSGGAVYNWPDAVVSINDSSITSNQAAHYGGGIYNRGVLEMTSSTLNDNSAIQGGGLKHDGQASFINNSTFSGNQADDGGGMYITSFPVGETGVASYPLTISFTTIAFNTAQVSGGGIFNNGLDLQITDSLVAENIGGDCSNQGNFFAFDENLDTDNSCPGFTLMAFPMLGILTDNGGPTLTRALNLGSPAIDAAGQCSVDGVLLANDQRGVGRPYGAACDLGAYEYNSGSPLVAATATPTPTTDLSWIGTVPAEILCYQGPDPAFGVVSSLSANSTVNLVGVSEQGSHVVLDNPRYPGVNCYVRTDQITIAEGVLALLPTIPDPSLPTPTATIAVPPTATVTSPPPATGSISGVVFKDGNSNGSQQGGEAGISGVTVHLGQGACASSGYQSKGTSGNGSFSFTNLPAGTYCLSVNIPLVCGTYSSATTPTQYTINLGPGGSISKLFGYATFPC